MAKPARTNWRVLFVLLAVNLGGLSLFAYGVAATNMHPLALLFALQLVLFAANSWLAEKLTSAS